MIKNKGKIYFIGIAFLTCVCFISAFCGRMDIISNDIISTFIKLPSLIPDMLNGDYSRLTYQERVLILIRFPRILMAVFVGAGLSVSGAAYQGLFRNPLVSPDILGVAAGCTFGAALGLSMPGSSFVSVRILSFIMGLLAVCIALFMAKTVENSRSLILVLTGVITGSLFHAFFMIIKTLADPLGELPAIVFWVMGSLSGSSWPDILIIFPIIFIGYIIFHLFRFRLNVLSLGDDSARSLGVNPKGVRLFLICVSSFIIAVCVSSCGQIAWVGLVVPHIIRSMLGPNHRFLIPCSALLGAAFLVLADNLARSMFSLELPLGVITSLIGAPVFAWLLYKNKNKGWA